MARSKRSGTTEANIRMGGQGRIVIPADMRSALELRDGDELAARVEGGRLLLEPVDAILARVQARFRRAVPPDVSMVDELLEERRAAARGESVP